MTIGCGSSAVNCTCATLCQDRGTRGWNAGEAMLRPRAPSSSYHSQVRWGLVTCELGKGGAGTPPRRRSRRRPLAVDLDDGQPLAVARLELGVAGDVDLFAARTSSSRCHVDQRLARALAQVTAGRVVEDDLRLRVGIDAARGGRLGDALDGEAVRGEAHARSFASPMVAQVSSNARRTMSLSFAFTSASFQKYSWRPWTHSK